MTLHIPKPVRLAVILMLSATAGVLGTLIIDRGDPTTAASTTTPRGSAGSSPRPVKAVVVSARSKRRVRLTVRSTPRQTAERSVTVRGRTTRGAKVTIRGRHATVQGGIYRSQLPLRIGTNRFTVVARHAGRRTRRRLMRIDRIPAPLPTLPRQSVQASNHSSDPCAPGNGHGDYNVPGSYIEPSLGYCVPPDGIEPEG